MFLDMNIMTEMKWDCCHLDTTVLQNVALRRIKRDGRVPISNLAMIAPYCAKKTLTTEKR